MEWYHSIVDDHSMKGGGTQPIRSENNGCCAPLNIHNGLAYLRIKCAPTDRDLETLPFWIMTAEAHTWDPRVLDHVLDEDADWFDAISDLPPEPTARNFDLCGDYHNRTVVQEAELSFMDADDGINHAHPHPRSSNSAFVRGNVIVKTVTEDKDAPPGTVIITEEIVDECVLHHTYDTIVMDCINALDPNDPNDADDIRFYQTNEQRVKAKELDYAALRLY